MAERDAPQDVCFLFDFFLSDMKNFIVVSPLFSFLFLMRPGIFLHSYTK